MMVEFPIMEDFKKLKIENGEWKMRLFLTHGHLYNQNRWPKPEQWLDDSDGGRGATRPTEKFVLVHGHTHIPEFSIFNSQFSIFNPGSVSLPKGGSSRSFGYFDGTDFKHYTI